MTTLTSTNTQVKSDNNDFFWTYTEEPHRSRRQAIIKAHPEVVRSFEVDMNDMTDERIGYQALRARAIDKVSRTCRRFSPSSLRISPERHFSPIMVLLPHGIHYWRDFESKPLPRHP
jgi:hypothetical protein